ncbi:hypothetical protein AAFF_G00110330 [Aldrovandia affinis]|uniref:Uncharacterized protein n=1 Tax=Aldrovandia affinis TaxID=143900 RepID=A0AAD7RTM0_9TELE|nr:hypothetical protein AAFF_G00110330 [Aldrovandia affinis]
MGPLWPRLLPSLDQVTRPPHPKEGHTDTEALQILMLLSGSGAGLESRACELQWEIDDIYNNDCGDDDGSLSLHASEGLLLGHDTGTVHRHEGGIKSDATSEASAPPVAWKLTQDLLARIAAALDMKLFSASPHPRRVSGGYEGRLV